MKTAKEFIDNFIEKTYGVLPQEEKDKMSIGYQGQIGLLETFAKLVQEEQILNCKRDFEIEQKYYEEYTSASIDEDSVKFCERVIK